jgi:hypothetical protein
MATTGELRAIIEELQLVDIGDAASYLGEEVTAEEEAIVSVQQATLPGTITVQQTSSTTSLCNFAI